MAHCKRPPFREVHINGLPWKYKFGKSFVRIWRPGSENSVRVATHKVIGVSLSDQERGMWKRTSDCSVTPGRVKNYIELHLL